MFDLEWGTHTLLMSRLYLYHKNIDPDSNNFRSMYGDIQKEKYLEEGCGYHFAFMGSWKIGKSYTMDEYDKILLAGEDVKKMRGLSYDDQYLAAKLERRDR